MSLLWPSLLLAIILLWMVGLTILVLVWLKKLQFQIKAPTVKGFRYWNLVHFNPFSDTGGNQSFALVLLDEQKDGIILTSLHSRGTTRFYAKTIRAGKADAQLSKEEKEALAQVAK